MEQLQTALIEQLGVSSEDALFFQQVLEEVHGAGSEPCDISATTSSERAEINDELEYVVDSIVTQANENPVLQKIHLEEDESTSRFSSAIWYDKIKQQTVILAGLGGIGRFGNLKY